MTIEEYLKISAEEIENTIPKGDNCDGNIYLAGKVDAYREILEKLPSFEHEVTLREVKEFCRVHKRESKEFNVCKGCALYFYEECLMKVPPRYLKTDDIERRMKEANRCRH